MDDNIYQEQAAELLRGGYDLHTHTIPSHVDRALDDFELIEQASTAHMCGVLIKCHYEPTGARARLVNRRMPQGSARAYGAVVLNHPVGGLNPYAAHSALEMGASIVFMPTRDAANCLLSGDMPGDFLQRAGLTVLDDAGCLKPAVYDIMDIVKQYDATLATGHLGVEESVKLCREGVARGVRMVLTHPEWDRTTVPVGIQRELARAGVWIEKCWYNIAEKNCTAAAMAQHIREIGAHHCFLTTDRGQLGCELPVKGMQRFAATLLAQQISAQDLVWMLHDAPRRVLACADIGHIA